MDAPFWGFTPFLIPCISRTDRKFKLQHPLPQFLIQSGGDSLITGVPLLPSSQFPPRTLELWLPMVSSAAGNGAFFLMLRRTCFAWLAFRSWPCRAKVWSAILAVRLDASTPPPPSAPPLLVIYGGSMAIWVGSKSKRVRANRRCWSVCPFTKEPILGTIFEPQPC